MHWGGIGCGNIAPLFIKGLQPLAHGSLLAVVFRTANQTEAFARQYKAKRIYSDYQFFSRRP